MTYRLARSMLRNRVADVGEGFDFGAFLLFDEKGEAVRRHGCPQWLTIECDSPSALSWEVYSEQGV